MIFNHAKRIVTSTALAGLCLLATAHAQTPFKIGQPAPEFKAGRWVKQGPIAKLEPGQIYVMEFWATWCGPCIAAMPHLTELAHKHAGKVTVIGVNILERSTGEKADRNVDQFVGQKGAEVDYPVCRDTADDYLKKAWFEPTRSPGIPTTVVVDASGKIAWIGHPIKLDAVLDDLLAGKFDYEKSAADHTQQAGKAEAMTAVFKEYGEAMKAKDWAKAVAVADNHPEFATTLWLMRFNALLQLNPAEAFEQMKEAVARKDRTAGSFLGSTADADNLPKEMYQYAADQLDRDLQPRSFGTRAALAYRLGDSTKAVEYQQKFKEFVLDSPRKPSLETIERLDNDLMKYRGKQ